MWIDRYELRNVVGTKYTTKIINLINQHGWHAGMLEDLIVEVAEEVLSYVSAKRETRKVNIPKNAVGAHDVRDKYGRRRFSLACVDDEPHMQPDIEGFWTPANDVPAGGLGVKAKNKSRMSPAETSGQKQVRKLTKIE